MKNGILAILICLTMLLQAALPVSVMAAEDAVSITEAEDVEISQENFPDTAFRKVAVTYDLDKDGYLSAEELAAVTSLTCTGNSIKDLTGIEYFTALTELNCSGNSLTSLDVTKNTALTILNCSSNRLRLLNISANAALKKLYCSINQMPVLDVSGCESLVLLWCDRNALTELDVSGMASLAELNCERNKIDTLKLDGAEALSTLKCADNLLEELEVGAFAALTMLDCRGNRLTALDVSANTALSILYCSKNKLTGLDVSRNGALTALYCTDMDLQIIDVSTNAALEVLDCSRCGLTDLDVSENSALGALVCDENYLNRLDMTPNQKLNYLGCAGNGMTELVIDNPWLTDLLCEDNQLTSLDLSGSMGLYELSCQNNCLTSLIVGSKGYVRAICCQNNQLTSLDLSGLEGLDRLNASNNHLACLNLDVIVSDFHCDNNVCEIVVDENGQFDLSCLPGFDLLMVDYTSLWGGTVSGSCLTMTGKEFSYRYDCSSRNTAIFRLQPAEASIELAPANAELAIGDTLALDGKGVPFGAPQEFVWTSSDPKIASVDANGVVTAHEYGKVTVTAEFADGSGAVQCEVQTRFADAMSSDVPERLSAGAFKSIYWAADAGITKGYADGTFGVERSCTRESFTIFLWRMAGKPEASAELPFSDTAGCSLTARRAISWAFANGIIKGYNDGTFRPDAPVSRANVVLMLYRFAGQPAVDASGMHFPDMDGYKPGAATYRAIAWAEEYGIVKGFSDGTFRPEADCIRSQIVTFLYRYDKNILQ